ncbi:hypothetical protein GCM10017781_06070 [Deinococcus metalli]|nr:hypothetical protein GCM10017781_06070 [Deinococcus metalli]
MVLVTDDTVGMSINCTAYDTKGNKTIYPTFTIQRDATAPSVVAAGQADPGADIDVGWVNSAQSATFTASDATSGLASNQGLTTPGNTFVLTVPKTVQSTSATDYKAATKEILDVAGNKTTRTLKALIDTGNPLLTVTLRDRQGNALSSQPWYGQDVTVDYTCSDALSGVVSCPADEPITASKSYPVQTISDRAGNTFTLAAFTVNIDKVAPTITYTTSPANVSGWVNSDVVVTFTCDALGGSPVSCPVARTISTQGVTTVSQIVTDAAGNEAHITPFDVRIDRTVPHAVLGVSPTLPGSGWYTTNVSFSASDTASDGYSPVTCSTSVASITADTAGTDVTATCTDAAGNTNTSAATTVKRDTIAPTITAAADRAPNGNDWYNANVTVTFTCSDGTSGLAGACPTAQSFTTDGNHAASATVRDQAGNETTSNTVNVHLDKTAPVISGSNIDDTTWRKTDLSASFTASDPLSGLNLSTDATFTLTASAESPLNGSTSVSKTVTDRAGNSVTRTLSAKIDKTAPVAKLNATGTLGKNSWYISDIAFNTAGSSDALSGLADCTVPATVTTDIDSTSYSTTCTDIAGNKATDSMSVKRDTTRPTLTVTPDHSANTNGWYNADVTATFTCADTRSGVAVCPSPVTVSTEKEGNVVSGTSEDEAGNLSLPARLSINLDKTAPVVSISASGPKKVSGSEWFTGDVTFTTSGSDALSGLDGACDKVNTADRTTDTNGLTASIECTDQAGNINKAEISIKRDATAPTIALVGPDHSISAWINTDLSQDYSATDTGSGIAPADEAFKLTVSTESKIVSGSVVPTTATKTVTDIAGNSATQTFSAKIDKTAPIISGSDVTNDVWRNTPLSVNFTASDALSGLNPSTDDKFILAASSETSSAGEFTTVSKTVVDQAGNTATRTLSAKIDLTKPTATVAATTDPNRFGWYNTDVDFETTGTDGLSGIASCTTPDTLTSDSDSHVASGTCTDHAGNVSVTASSAPVKRDTVAPTMTLTAPTAGLRNGWYRNDVTFTLAKTDDRSGVNDVSCTGPAPITGEGTGLTTSASCQDKAGNTGTVTSASVQIDHTAPTATLTPSPAAPNGLNGWYKTGPITFTTSGSDVTPSGVNGVSGNVTCTAVNAVTADSAGTPVNTTCTDAAGNSASSAPLTVKLDTTAPAATIKPTPVTPDGSNGWYRSAVNFATSGTDAMSGGVTCTPIATITTSTANSTVNTTCTDVAGNQSSASSGPYRVDLVNPVLSQPDNISVFATGGGQATATFSIPAATDDMTAPPAVTCDRTSGLTVTVGFPITVTCTAIDAAGRTDQKVFTITARYNFTGFFQPIDMSELNADGTVKSLVYNTVKSGSAVPVKFKLGGYQNMNIFAAGFPMATNIPCNATAPVDDVEELSTATNSGLTWDATAQQYVYVWKTNTTAQKAGSCYQLTVKFIDGTSRTAFFKVK